MRHKKIDMSSVFYPVSKPDLSGKELYYVTQAIKSGWVSSSGPHISRFEKEFARFIGAKYAIACSNGTAALHLSLLALDIGPGDEVIVPSLTFIATANAVRYAGAKPVFVDVDPIYWQIDPEKIERAITKKTKAIIPVHLYGHPARMDKIMRIARTHKLFVVEDAAEAIGAEVNKKKVGTWGDVGVFSFHAAKVMTTGEGGMVVTNDSGLAQKVKVLHNHGRSRTGRYFLHDTLGFNYLMTNLQAAVGLGQLARVDAFLKAKIRIAEWYSRFLKGTRGVVLPSQAPWAMSAHWLYSILIDPKAIGKNRDAVITELRKKKVESRPFFVPIHTQSIYKEYNHIKLPNTESLGIHGLNLPSFVTLRKKDVSEIVKRLQRVLDA